MLAYVLDLSSKPGLTPLQQLANLQVRMYICFNLECCFSLILTLECADVMSVLLGVQTEVQQYSSDLVQKTTILVGNKVDQLGEESEGLRDRLEAATGMHVHFVSARYGQGLECVREALARLVCKSRDL